MKPHALCLLAFLLMSIACADAPRRDDASSKAIEITVTEKGYEPARIPIKRGVETRLIVTRKTDSTCARDILIPSLGVREALPLDKPVEVKFTPKEAGELKFGCAMDGMVGGLFVVE